MAASAATTTSVLMDDSVDEVTLTLRQIASDDVAGDMSSQGKKDGDVMREFGAPTNNMLLNIIRAETKRTADEVKSLSARVSRNERLLEAMVANTTRMCTLLETQNTILSSLHDSSRLDSSSPMTTGDSTLLSSTPPMWYYQGMKITNRSRSIACLTAAIMHAATINMEQRSIRYEDSVDCDFHTLELCISEVCRVRCTIPSIPYKDPIDIPDMRTDKGFVDILQLVASRSESAPAYLAENRFIELVSPHTHKVLSAFNWIRQRLCFLECIMSPKQIDILKALDTPISRSEEEGLNLDFTKIVPRRSHPIRVEVHRLPPAKKRKFVERLMKRDSLNQAFVTAVS